jgi:sodium/proline symporter
MSATYITFALYFVALLALGVIAWKRTSNLSDYILGGRSLGSGVSALSASASDMSGWLLLGLPGALYMSGLGEAWIGIGLLIGTWANWQLVARRLRVATAGLDDALTLPDYFQRRFSDRSMVLRVLPALLIFFFFSIYLSSGLVAGGLLFETVFGLPYIWAVGFGLGAIILYTFLGGFLAVSWTDALQGILMVLALIAVPLLVMGHGDTGLFEAVREKNPDMLNLFTDANGDALGLLAIASLMAWGLGYFGQPHVLARFMGIRSPDHVPVARRIAVSWVAICLLGAVLVGLGGIGTLPEPLTSDTSETVFIRLVELLFHPVIAGILLAAILAAIMSTADSQLLVASSAVAEDFYKGLLRPQASQGELIWIGRGSVVAIALVAFVIALDPNAKVLDLVSYAWAGLGASFGPVILLSLYWSKMTRWGAVAGMLTGGLTVYFWKAAEGGLFDLYELLPAFILAGLVAWLVSLATQSDQEQQAFSRMLQE